MTPEEKAGADRASSAAASPSARQASPSTRVTRVIAVASGKGGVGKSSLTANLAAAFSGSGHAHRRPRRRRLRLLDPDDARDQPAPGRRRQDDRAAGARRPQGDVHRLLPRRQHADHVARADAAPSARAVPLRRPLGRARHARGRHAAGHRRRRHLARSAPSAGGGGGRHDSSPGCATGRGAGGADGAEDEHAPPRRHREHVVPRRLRGRALRLRRRRARSPRRSRRRSSARIPFDPRLGAAPTRASRSSWPTPRREVSQAIMALAEAIAATKREQGIGIVKPLPLVSA